MSGDCVQLLRWQAMTAPRAPVPTREPHHAVAQLQETQAGELLALQLQQQAQQLAAQQGAAVGGMLHPGMLMAQQQAMLPAPAMHQMRQVPGQTQGFAIDPQVSPLSVSDMVC